MRNDDNISMITDHGSRINNKEVPKTLINDQCSLIIERSQTRRGEAASPAKQAPNSNSQPPTPNSSSVPCNLSPVTSPLRPQPRGKDACTTKNGSAALPYSSNSQLLTPNSFVKSRKAGFTLIEILVVLSIIVLLIALLVPAAIVAQRYAYSSTTQGDLAALSQALSLYHTDFSVYPDSDLCYSGPLYTTAPTAVQIPQYAAYDYLAECLTGYLPGEEDGYPSNSTLGANGYSGGNLSQCAGFTMQPYKKVYGPYMPANAQNITPDGAAAGNYYFSGDFPPTTGAPLPILYFSATTSPSGSQVFDGQPSGVVGPGVGVFCLEDDKAAPGFPVLPKPSNAPADVSANDSAYQYYQFLPVVGDKTSTNNVSGGTITGRNSYLLVAPGPSQLYFTGDNLVYGGG